VEKCRKDAEVTKVRYEQSLTELNAYNAKYVEDMTEVYNRTQEFEERRLKFFKKVLYDLHACLDLTQNKRFVDDGSGWTDQGNVGFPLHLRFLHDFAHIKILTFLYLHFMPSQVFVLA